MTVGKGDARRPGAIPEATFREQYDDIFRPRSCYCDRCGLLHSWCECEPEDLTVEGGKNA